MRGNATTRIIRMTKLLPARGGGLKGYPASTLHLIEKMVGGQNHGAKDESMSFHGPSLYGLSFCLFCLYFCVYFVYRVALRGGVAGY